MDGYDRGCEERVVFILNLLIHLLLSELMNPIIKVEGLTKHFNDLVAVDGLSFTVGKGDVFGFLGQNGAGKSTTIRMLLTLIEPTSGSIEIFGLDLKKHRKEILRQIGAIIEKPDVYKYLTALENLRLFSKISGGKSSNTNRLMEQLEQVGLQDRAHSKVKTFSQGMKQRLGVAIALVHDPGLIILDEPTNGLDPQGIADVRNLILYLSHTLKKTVMVSSHLLNEIEMIANRVLIIDGGKKMVEGNATDLFDPVNTLIELETTDNELALLKLKGTMWENAIQPKRSDKIVIRMERKDVPTFNELLVHLNIRVLSIQARHSLEDYFLQITTKKQHVETFKD
ncbi:MAG: ABC transporter ATP-binding protein [Ginsengibacter sp.]